MEYETRSATYYVDNLKHSKLFMDLEKDLSKGVVPILKLKILQYALTNVFFTDEKKATHFLHKLNRWEKEKDSLDSLKNILKVLNTLMMFDCTLYGSFIVDSEGIITWDLDICILLPN